MLCIVGGVGRAFEIVHIATRFAVEDPLVQNRRRRDIGPDNADQEQAKWQERYNDRGYSKRPTPMRILDAQHTADIRGDCQAYTKEHRE
jgi:hypothetical protein